MKISSLRAKDKRAISNIIAYVLLISITLSLSVMVYNWLMYYVDTGDNEIPECPEGVNVIIYNYSCYQGSDFSFTLKNKGLFSIDGFIVRIHDRPDPEFGIYTINLTGVPLAPGEFNTMKYYFLGGAVNGEDPIKDVSKDTESERSLTMDTITMIDVQPFRKGDDGKISCQSRAVQMVRTCPSII